MSDLRFGDPDKWGGSPNWRRLAPASSLGCDVIADNMFDMTWLDIQCCEVEVSEPCATELCMLCHADQSLPTTYAWLHRNSTP